MPRARGTPRVRGALKFTQRAQTKSTRTRRPRHLAAPRRINGPPFGRPPQVRHSQGVPRAVFLRFAPQRPRWTYLSDNPRSPCELRGCLSTAHGPKWRPALLTVPAAIASGVAVAHGRCAGTSAAWTAGQCQRISAATSFPGHRSPFHVRDAVQTPLGIETGCAQHKCAPTSGDKFFFGAVFCR